MGSAETNPQHLLPELETPRLLLRQVRESDTEDVWEIYSDRKALEYFAREPLKDMEEARQMVAENLCFGEDPAAKIWAICHKDGDRMIGTFTLFHISQSNRRAEVGFILKRSSWGQGFASEALGRVIDYCFEDLDMVRLEADADPENHASLKLLERHGFEREGYFRKRWFMRDEWFDSVMLGLLKEG
ncbi:MAG: GNAT family N-acetyltransferase [Xanthomonadales bacterium]|nr:GNAT family N-acetyltransferase [Xanthomonadales bacterium]